MAMTWTVDASRECGLDRQGSWGEASKTRRRVRGRAERHGKAVFGSFGAKRSHVGVRSRRCRTVRRPEELEDVVAGACHGPLGGGLLEAPQVEPPEVLHLLELTKHGFDDGLAPSVHSPAIFRPELGLHSFLGARGLAGQRWRRFTLGAMPMSLGRNVEVHLAKRGGGHRLLAEVP